ncbi:MAG: DUF72 domain-containing protein [Desulfurococcaceae archaeon]
MKTISIGCCGFPVSRKKYYEVFNVVELQNTFYELPTIEWAENLRKEAPAEFEFTVKAWQVITHPYTSPTWKKMKKKLSGDLENYGYLKPTIENINAFVKTIELARVLRSNFIVLQTPSSMPNTDEMIKKVDEFFEKITPHLQRGLSIGWEIRGDLIRNMDLVKILEKHNVIHVVDIFRNKPLHIGDPRTLYIRLHGIGPGEVNYKYNYTVDDLEKLRSMLIREDYSIGYIFFNNVRMYDNASLFKNMLVKDKSLRVV